MHTGQEKSGEDKKETRAHARTLQGHGDGTHELRPGLRSKKWKRELPGAQEGRNLPALERGRGKVPAPHQCGNALRAEMGEPAWGLSEGVRGRGASLPMTSCRKPLVLSGS